MSKDAYVKDANNWKHTQSTLYLYQEQNEIGALEKDVFTQLRFLGLGKGAEIGAAVAIELNGQFYAHVHDLNGSVVCLLDESTGNAVANYRYSAFGEEQNFGQVKNQWRYASKRVDPESGFVYFGRRYYAPQFGRWITPDPLDFEDGPNLYAYLHNNPMTYFDEYGLEAAPTGIGTPGYIGFSQSIIANASSALQAGLDIGTGAINGITHPLDTMSSWSGNSQDNAVSVSNATRVGEVCGVGLLLVPTAAAVRVVTYGIGKVLLSQGARLLASAPKVARSLFAGKVARESSNIAVKKSSQTVIKSEATLVKEIVTGKVPPLDTLSKAGQAADRAGLTKAGRALDKHGNRPDSVFPKATGNQASKNMQGQYQLDDILTHPSSRTVMDGNVGFEIIAPNGRAAYFRLDGSFRGFTQYK